MTDLTDRLKELVCAALNDGTTAEDVLKALIDTEERLAEFMLKHPQAHRYMRQALSNEVH